jgi:hypothetical protein
MTDISSFVKLSPRETVLERWEVVADDGKPTVGELILGLALWAVLYYALRFITWFLLLRHIGYYELREGGLSIFATLLWLLTLLVPGALVAWSLLGRSPMHGHLCVTNWRLISFAHGQGRWRSLFAVSAVNLEDVLGIHTFYTEGLGGHKTLEIMLHTRFHDGMKIEAGTVGSFLHRVPVFGKFMVRNTLGKDAFAMLPILYKRIRQHTGETVSSSLTY